MPPRPLALHPTSLAYRRRIGAYEVTALSDGFVDLSFGVWQNIERDDFDNALEQHFLFKGGFRNGITSFLVNTGNKLVMIDAGAAGLFGPNSFHFPRNLSDAGVRSEDIDLVLPTHAHPDHIGALVSNGAAVLPNARILIEANELDFWTSAAARAKAPEFMRGWWDAVGAVVAAYRDRVDTFRAGADLGDGITAVSYPGHTPGHTGYLIESAGERLMIWGDLVVHHAIQFEHPKASMIFDIDAALGHRSRLRGFDMAASDRLLTASTHLPFPTFGYVARRNGGFRWVPEVWQHDVAKVEWRPVA